MGHFVLPSQGLGGLGFLQTGVVGTRVQLRLLKWKGKDRKGLAGRPVDPVTTGRKKEGVFRTASVGDATLG